MKLLWLDTETTGLLPYKHDIIQMSGIVEIAGEVQEEFDYTLAPINIADIQQSALDINGRTRHEILQFPDARQQLNNMCRLLDKYVTRTAKGDNFILAGYNVTFDQDFLKNLFKKTGTVGVQGYFAYKVFDVYTLVFMLTYLDKIPTLENMKLTTMCAHFNIALDAHDSMNDIRATRELFLKLCEYIK